MSWISEDRTIGSYTMIINTWKGTSPLEQSVAHYATCGGTDAIHVVWRETDPPSESLKAYLRRIVFLKSQTDIRFEINKEDELNDRFKVIDNIRTDRFFVLMIMLLFLVLLSVLPSLFG